jgi:LmbE family N-acetylglucosaminyl deacetylase
MNVLAFFAHPDDETMLCGGTLALLKKLGARLHILIATRGEGGEMGEPPLCEREELGKVREQELLCAAQALGADQLLLLDYIDPTVGPDNQLFPFATDLDRLATQVRSAIHETQADVVLCHGRNGEYGHPAHQLAHQAAVQAVASLGEKAPLFYTVMGSFDGHPYPRLLNADVPAHWVIDVSPFLEQKLQAALCHKTQHALFVRHRSEEAGRPLTIPEVILTTESLSRVYPSVENGSAPQDALSEILLNSGLARPA